MWQSKRALARGVSVIVPAAALALGAQADSIRVDDVWYQDVYVVETAQFYHILNPADGTTLEVSKKRQDVSEPRLTKDDAERDALKAKWEVAAQEREKADARDIELRVREGRLSNRDPNAPKPERRKLSPAEEAARRAAWQQKLEERAMAMEVRQQILDERAGILPQEEPVPEEASAPVEANSPDGEAASPTEEQQPTPPGPRQQPEDRPMTEEERAAAQQEAMQQEMERLQMEPYFYNEQERILWEQQQQAEFERLQAEAYFWEQMQSQGYLNAAPYVATPLNSHMAPGPVQY